MKKTNIRVTLSRLEDPRVEEVEVKINGRVLLGGLAPGDGAILMAIFEAGANCPGFDDAVVDALTSGMTARFFQEPRSIGPFGFEVLIQDNRGKDAELDAPSDDESQLRLDFDTTKGAGK